jgi:hypothetical protein
VVDTLDRFIMKDYDYRGLGDLDDDVVLLEWDMAVHREEFESFLGQVREAPDRVLVAPYKVYTATQRPENLRQPVWVPRVYADASEQSTRHVQPGEPECHLFGLGLTYLPRDLIQGFLADWPGHFNDVSFSGWHYRQVGAAPIAWDVRPVHLHYLIERMV